MRAEDRPAAPPTAGGAAGDPLQDVLQHIQAIERRLKSIELLVGGRARKRQERLRGKFSDPMFQQVADTVLGQRRTLLGQDRLFVLWQCIRNVLQTGLPAAEVGTYRGGSAFFIASAFVALSGHEVPLHVFDTFEGHPATKVSEFDPFHKPGMFSDTSLEDVMEYLSIFTQLYIHKGEFSEAIRELSELSYSLVHLDVDLYVTTLDCLRYFGSRVVPGGVLVIDDFEAKKCPGVVKAVAAYLEEANLFQTWQMPTEQLLLVKK